MADTYEESVAEFKALTKKLENMTPAEKAEFNAKLQVAMENSIAIINAKNEADRKWWQENYLRIMFEPMRGVQYA